MSRTSFLNWGASLPQERFAEAVAAIGVLGAKSATINKEAVAALVRRFRKLNRDIVPLATHNLAQFVKGIRRKGPGSLDPSGCLWAWACFRDLWRHDQPGNAPFLRLEIVSSSSRRTQTEAPDLLWLLRLLQEAGRELADSVYVRVDKPDRPIAWEWPLRVGVLGDPRSAEIGDCIANIPWTRLVKVVPLASLDEDCDLLLLPGNLRGATAHVLQHPRRLRADCVLLLGGTGVAEERLQSLVATLRSEVLTGGVGVVHVDPENEGLWVTRFFEQLSHDLPLDIALHETNRLVAVAPPPLLIASHRLATNARLSAFASRFGGQVKRMAFLRAAPPRSAGTLVVGQPPPPLSHDPASSPASRAMKDVGNELENQAQRGSWMSESGDASTVVRLRGKIESMVGTPLRAERAGERAAPERDREDRSVRFGLTDTTDPAAAPKVQDHLEADHAYEINLSIGLPRSDLVSASIIFPSEKLPPSRDGHFLDVFFVPLARTATGRMHTPQQARLFLPTQGDSEPCTMSFRTHGVREEYRARVLITHENRVIQTLIFHAPIGESSQQLALDVETLVAPTFDATWQGRPFDAAIVVNHGTEGLAGFTTLVGTEVAFLEPHGVDKTIDQIKHLLSSEATFPDSHGQLDDPELLRLFDDLARYGRAVLKAMHPMLQGRVPEGGRVQVVEARSGAWLPIEMFYGARLPKPGATLCPNAHNALSQKAGVDHEHCLHRDDPNHHCPLRFWGLSCVIERQPPLGLTANAEYTIRVPRPGADRLDALRSALIGASQMVRPQDLQDPGGIVEAVRRAAGTARTVGTWEEWEQAIAEDSPSLLVLLPHSQEDPQHKGITGLEIGGALLTYPELESSFVVGPDAGAPVVLLLGCSTQLTDVPFLNFVEAFKREKAALVIGTLATIRGRRTVAFVSALLEGLHAAQGSDRTFGEVFLATKRRLLADGDGFVLSLTAYGDVGWRI